MEPVEYLKIKIQQLERQQEENQKYVDEEEIKYNQKILYINQKMYDTNFKTRKN